MTRILILSVAILVSTAALAQSPPTAPKSNDTAPAATPEVRDTKACSQQRMTVGPDGKPQADTNGASLSDKLAKSDGVICPPSNVDADIKAPAPQTGSAMPVIPPPGSPGGDQSVQPK